MRCFEYYCMYEKAPERCEIQSRTVDWQVRKYMKAFKDRGVKFDYSEENKKLFYELHDELGSERAYVRPDEQRQQGEPKLYRCGFPGCQKGAYYPIFHDNVPVCPDCDRKIQDDPSLAEKLGEKLPQIVEKKKYHPPEDWRERMHPLHSRMENEVIRELQAEGWNIGTDEDAVIPLTTADGLEKNIRLPLFLHGPHHKKSRQQEWDEMVEKILVWRRMPPVIEWHERYSVKRKEEIKACFRERMIQGYREKGLELPRAVKGAHQNE